MKQIRHRLFPIPLLGKWAKPFHCLWALLLLPCLLPGQSAFQVSFDTLPIVDMPRLHSFAYAKHEGKWLLLGGR